MDIKINKIFALFFFICGLNAFNAQSVENKIPENFKNKLYQIMFQQSSANGKYAAFKKVYEKNNDTLVLIDATRRNAVVWEEGSVSSFYFTSNNKLFYQKKKEIISYDVLSKTSLNWKDITQWNYLEKEGIFVLSKKTEQESTVLIIDENGKEIEKFHNSKYFKVVGNTVLIVSNSGNEFVVEEYNHHKRSFLFNRKNPINFIFDNNNTGVIFREELPSQKNDIAYFYKGNKTVSVLSKSWKYDVLNVETYFVDDSQKILLKTAVANDKLQKEVVDLWYGNAKDLRTKFYAKKEVLKDIVWNPGNNSVTELNDKKCTNYFALGNTRYLVCLDEFKYENYTNRIIPYPIYRYDLENGEYKFLGDLGNWIYADGKGELILSKKDGEWELYSLNTLKKRVIRSINADVAIFSSDSKNIIFEDKHSIKIYDIAKDNIVNIPFDEEFEPEIKNVDKRSLGGNIHIEKSIIDVQQPLVVKLFNANDFSTSLAVIHNNKVHYVERKIPERLLSVNWNKQVNKLLYTVENINLPPQLRVHHNKANSSKIIYNSNLQDQVGRKIKFDIVNYSNSHGKSLNGVLIYPTEFKKGQKYPMIVNIYEKQSMFRNQFLMDGFAGSTDAINIRYYLERGYMIYLPDIVFGEQGTGWSALDCVESSVKALRNNPAIDFDNLALIGFSHGGYETNFIATQSKIFKTYLAGGANSDLVRSYFSFNYNFLRPFYYQFENGQYRMKQPFKNNKDLYISNSPVYHAEKVNAPVLLWAGMKDQNIYWEQTMEFYLGLKRNDKKVIALFYKDEAHGFQKPDSKLDIYTRVSEWIDYHLKGKKNDWIDKMYGER